MQLGAVLSNLVQIGATSLSLGQLGADWYSFVQFSTV